MKYPVYIFGINIVYFIVLRFAELRSNNILHLIIQC